MFWVYILQNPAGKFYIGQTDNPELRLHSHNRTDKTLGKFTRKAARGNWKPILICHERGRDLLAGYVLPFDDILHHFAGPDMDNVRELSNWWIQNYAKAG